MTIHILPVIFLLMGLIPFGLAFNIDTDQPSEYTAGSESSSDSPRSSSMFGYTVAQHITHTGTLKLLVGAPKAQTEQPGVIRGGAVYECTAPGPGGRVSCRPMVFDTEGNEMYDTDWGTTEALDEKSNQWFGASISSSRNASTGDVLACAPRYVYHSTNLDKKLPIGQCFHYRGSWGNFKKLAPLKNTVEFYQGRDPTSFDQYTREGQGMYGFSSAVNPDGARLLIGAVGSFAWKGRLYVHEPISSARYGNSLTGPYEEGLYSVNYMTYSTAIGNFSSSSSYDYVVATPRGGGLGPKEDLLAGHIRIYNVSMKRLDLIIGDQMGDYFGYSLAVGDFNGDSLDDIAIGAPFYAEDGSGFDTGRVVVLYQRALGIIYSRRHVIQGQKLSGERFGLSLAVTGDLNGDGFSDLAVGAPYGGMSGEGAVHIFHGSRNGIKTKASQIIYGRSISTAIRTFGYSITAGLDMDSNGYPDIAVGSYSSDSIVQLCNLIATFEGYISIDMATVKVNLIRVGEEQYSSVALAIGPQEGFVSRPVLRLYLNVSVPSSVELKTESTLAGETTSFPVILRYRHEGKTPNSETRLNVTVKLDADRDNQHRAYFLDPSGRKITRNLVSTFRGASGENEIRVPGEAYIKSGLRDKLAPIVVEATFNVIIDLGSGLPEVLDADLPTRVRAEVHIKKNCGEDQACVADLGVIAQSARTDFAVGEATLDLNVQVNNSAEDDAFEAQVFVHLPPATTYIRVFNVKSLLAVKCTPRSASTDDENEDLTLTEQDVICEIGNPLPGNSTVEFSLSLDTSRFEGSLVHLPFSFNVTSSNPENETTLGNNWADITVPVRAETPIQLSGISRPEQVLLLSNESSSTDKQNLDNSITHLYSIYNLGPSTLESATVIVYWPSRFEEEDGGDLFVLTGRPLVKQEIISTCQVEYATDPTEHNTTDLIPRLRRTVKSITEKVVQNKEVNKAVVCKAGLRQSFCSKITCKVSTLAQGESASIEIQAELPSRTMAQMTILVSSQAEARVDSVPYAGIPAGDFRAYYRVDTILTTRGVPQEEVAIWVYGVSAAAGILFLIIIILICKYCGFFERSQFGEDEAMLGSVTDDIDNDVTKDTLGFESEAGSDVGSTTESQDLFLNSEAGSRSSCIDPVNRKLIFQNGISISIEEKR